MEADSYKRTKCGWIHEEDMPTQKKKNNNLYSAHASVHTLHQNIKSLFIITILLISLQIFPQHMYTLIWKV